MNPLLLWPLRLLSLTALGLSAYLTYASLSVAGVSGCDFTSAFDCDAALSSPWAKWFGLPVAVGGTLCYLATLAGSFLISQVASLSALGWRVLEATVPATLGAGLWFLGVQFLALDSFCLYCLLTHACGLAIAVLVLLLRNQADEGPTGAPAVVGLGSPAAQPASSTGPPALGLPTALGVAVVVLLAGGQLLGPKPPEPVAQSVELDEQVQFDDGVQTASAKLPQETQDDPEPSAEAPQPEAGLKKNPRRKKGGSRQLALLNDSLKIDAYKHPILGSPEAEHIVVELMDYACPHCRELHDKVEEAIDRFDGKVAVIVMPVPGEITCNPYATKSRAESLGACYAAKLALSVAELAPENFPQFHHWMLREDKIPRRTASLIEAQRHADRNELSVSLRDEEGLLAKKVKQYIGLSVQLNRMGVRGVPAQILGDKAIAKNFETADELIGFWAETFGLERPAAELPF